MTYPWYTTCNGRKTGEPKVREPIKANSRIAQTAAVANNAEEFPPAICAGSADWICVRFLPLNDGKKKLVEFADITVHYLEMVAPLQRSVPAPRDDLTVLHARRPTVPYYRFLYDGVGKDYHWLSRRKLSDDELATIIQDPRNELHVLHVDGSPAGFAELDRRQTNEIELVQFGLMPEFIGQGLGKWFLQWTIDKAWSYEPKRFWLHTCTLDHPAALPTYKDAGFVQYTERRIHREL